MTYYYLEGLSVKGPVDLDVLSSMNLSNDTWVKTDDMKEWIKLGTVLKPQEKSVTVENNKFNSKKQKFSIKSTIGKIICTILIGVVAVVNTIVSINLLKPIFTLVNWSGSFYDLKKEMPIVHMEGKGQIIAMSTLSGVLLLIVTLLVVVYVVKHLYFRDHKLKDSAR